MCGLVCMEEGPQCPPAAIEVAHTLQFDGIVPKCGVLCQVRGETGCVDGHPGDQNCGIPIAVGGGGEEAYGTIVNHTLLEH